MYTVMLPMTCRCFSPRAQIWSLLWRSRSVTFLVKASPNLSATWFYHKQLSWTYPALWHIKTVVYGLSASLREFMPGSKGAARPRSRPARCVAIKRELLNADWPKVSGIIMTSGVSSPSRGMVCVCCERLIEGINPWLTWLYSWPLSPHLLCSFGVTTDSTSHQSETVLRVSTERL